VGRIPDDDVVKVRDATDLPALIAESVVLKKRGRLLWGNCPFHQEKTPSFKVDPATQLWHCFGCGRGGDAIGFVMEGEGLDFPDAVRRLADRARIEIREEGGGGLPAGHKERLLAALDAAADHYHRLLVSSKDAAATSARAYLKGRGFGLDVAKGHRLGFAPRGRDSLADALLAKGFTREELVEANLALADEGGRLKDRFFDRIMFPIVDLSGRVVGFGGRVLGDGVPKYLNSADTPVFHKAANLYGIHEAKNHIVRTGTAIVVEGYTDVIALHEAGVCNAVATLGTALGERHVRLLSRFAKRVVYLFDGDEAGLRAADRASEFLDWQATPEAGAARVDLLVAVIPEGRDPADLVAAEGVEGVERVVTDALPLVRFVLDRRLDAHDLSSPEGRSRALADAVAALVPLGDSVLAHDYVNYIAGRLLVDYATVQRALHGVRSPRAAVAHSAADESSGPVIIPPSGPEGRAEREVLRLLAVHQSLRAQARDSLSVALFIDPLHARLFEAVLGAGTAVGAPFADAVCRSVPEAAGILSAWLVDEREDEAIESAFRDVADRIKGFDLERRISVLKGRIRSLDPAKDAKEIDDTFRQVAALTREAKTRRRDTGTGTDGEA